MVSLSVMKRWKYWWRVKKMIDQEKWHQNWSNLSFPSQKKDLLLTGLFNIANMHRQSQINFINLRIAIFQQNNTLLPSDARHWKFVFWNYFKALKKVQFKNINCPSSVSNKFYFFFFFKIFLQQFFFYSWKMHMHG